MIDDVAVFEKAAKKSWQSFSTMRRFVDEAVRLENASWRLWFVQGTHGPAGNDSSDEPDAEDYSAITDGPRPLCVYCELHRASLSCNGCCHDAYCVSCFKLIHKKGNLATHTAVKIQIRELNHASVVSATCEDADISTTSHRSSLKKNDSLEGDAECSTGTSSPHQKSGETSLFNKPWELQMDMLLQRLMMNSIQSELDISVRNIDRRESLVTADAIGSLLDADDVVSSGSTSESDEEDTRQKSNQAVVMAAVAAAGRHRAHSMSFEESGKRSPVITPMVIHPSPPGVDGGLDDLKLPPTLFPKGLPRTNSRRRDSQTCANCNGNHITVECPLLESALMPPATTPTPGGSGVDTALRKCFTTIHNNNMANSTHAFLGDEVSVRGGSNFANMKQWPSSNSLQQMDRQSPFGMNVIAEDNSMASEDLAPVLGQLTPPNARGTPHHWNADSWLLSCLATELPFDVFEQLRGERNAFLSGSESSAMAITGWVLLKVPGSQWCRRYLSLYRNNLWEYLDANDTSRPVGHANVYEGSVHSHQRSTTEYVLKYNTHSSAVSGRSELWLQFDSKKDARRWKEMLTRAVELQIDDLFDLTPDSPTGTSAKNFELGKGRFSIVRRARRKESWDDSSRSKDCALKIIEKNIFWDLVSRDTEREDTVVREILTQSLLTVRSGSSYCPVIRLQSLFETRDHLVMELELMRDGDLHEEIATKSAVDETRASFLVASLVRAIDYCQRNGVAHRDVKLSNLALDFECSASGKEFAVIKVADFGMAAFIQKDGMLKGRCGTPGFVAPEILCAGKGEAYPSGVDMFSAGVVAYTMLCGYEPFFGVNDDELIQMNKRVDFEFEEPEWSSISDDAKDMVRVIVTGSD
ncbi:calcium/calmodulin-dependent protein kinase, putative [Phytophthora infestans T30-4]|uniref:Calcium/calmodulin-dependent protein kinase, putative n=1 Tax=Phytophthora infestans (strain T30-4) TaxID=403677 RepID=D0N4G1_PHYIT|nr:calcium/calmodulin-dependent protein kinase, putative [Phytophthora infestans T30-4]EEY69769.1 calcium/calmodulin-dependent protein kinase, putative [Phytophthora infestans T30-4]|eukprot:XP_002998416.1 calcium/calmodulin-dependent protein kinase, putative [Phytophthora infestans T30-4]